MCLAVPAKVISIDGNKADVDMAGTIYHASITMTPEAKVGDYVLLHTGYAIQILDEKEALETIKIFQELGMLAAEDEIR